MNQTEKQDFKASADVGSQRVARVYAEALVKAAEKSGQADAVVIELDTLIREIFTAEPQFEEFLASGAISRDRKAQVIHSVLESRASPILIDFLLVLNTHARLNLLRAILMAARQFQDTRAGRMQVLAQTAVPMPADQQERLASELRETFHREPVLQTQVNPDLLGGLVVRIEDWVYDASVRTQLETLRNQLIARSNHEIQSRRDRFSSANGD